MKIYKSNVHGITIVEAVTRIPEGFDTLVDDINCLFFEEYFDKYFDKSERDKFIDGSCILINNKLHLTLEFKVELLETHYSYDNWLEDDSYDYEHWGIDHTISEDLLIDYQQHLKETY